MEFNPYLAKRSSSGSELDNSLLAVLQLLVELLKQLLAGIGNPAHRHGLLLPEEVMVMLRISDRTLRRYNEEGTLCPLRIGGMRYYLMSDIIHAGQGKSV